MKTKCNNICIISLLFFLLLSSCKNDLKRSQWFANPNGDSELALLMREMYDDVMMMKTDVEAGKVPRTIVDHKALLTATPTEAGKNESAEYRQYADAYLQVLNALDQSDYKNAEETYENLVNMCFNCHKAVCPGPTAKIEHLVLK